MISSRAKAIGQRALKPRGAYLLFLLTTRFPEIPEKFGKSGKLQKQLQLGPGRQAIILILKT
jgi:hypothetical protein